MLIEAHRKIAGRAGAVAKAFLIAILLGPGRVHAAGAPHTEEVAAFAALMADLRTAAQRCPGLQIDEDRVAAEKDRLHIAEVDYFAFRKTARDRADALDAQLVTPAAVEAWCRSEIDRYGSQGTAVHGALRR